MHTKMMQKPPVEVNPQIMGCICLIFGGFKEKKKRNHQVMKLIRHTRIFPVLFLDENQPNVILNIFFSSGGNVFDD